MKAEQSPLFIPALWEEDHFRIIDETLLPWKIEYITVNEVSEALRAVKEMKTRAFGQVLTFLHAAALVARGAKTQNSEPLRERLARLAEEFTEARPTFDFEGIAKYFDPWFQGLSPGEETGSWLEGKIHELVAIIQRTKVGRAAVNSSANRASRSLRGSGFCVLAPR